VAISGSVLSGNFAGGDGGLGGGIFNDGTLTLSASNVTGNSAEVGGGIYNATFSNGPFASLTVSSGSTVSGNSAEYGGGIYNSEGALTVSGSTVSGNSATYEGGGIFNREGALTVSGSTVSGNSAEYGGGIYNFAEIAGAYALISNSSTVSGNTGTGADVYNLGVLYLDSSSTIGVLQGDPAILI
jgi:hypothetical protein